MRFITTLLILGAGVGTAQLLNAQAPQRTFDTPDDAAKVLIQAASSNDAAALAAIFGPKGATLLTSGNAAQDKSEREEFAGVAQHKYALEQDSMNRDRMILSIGDQDWPFPAPIVKVNGKWVFDSSMGQTMMRARRIGANELDAIEICAGYAAAENQYSAQHGGAQYALRSMSSPGKDDGLYSDAHPLVPKQFAEAVADGASNTTPKRYHGYYFKVLTSQGPDAPGGRHDYLVKNALMGGYALVAWPAEYGVSGIRTFIVNHEGVVFEADLGRPANATAAPVARFNPDRAWQPVN
jgi:Protein of unknown function (DUF2950)